MRKCRQNHRVFQGIAAIALVLGITSVVSGCKKATPHHVQVVEANHEQTRFPVTIRRPKPAEVGTGMFDDQGRELTIACVTCHASRSPNLEAHFGSKFTVFHQKTSGKHGTLSCSSCHNPADGYNSLRLADGKSVPYPEVMTLCAQCHGPQYRDYLHGAHGGMSGYWDTSKGERLRNNCIDCHTAHSPKYHPVTPVRGPNDRFPAGGRHE